MKDDGVYLRHVLRCIARIEEYTVAGRESFFSSHLIQDGVVRNLQTLAESSQRLSESIKESYPEVDWKGLAGFRNVLVHDYLGVTLYSSIAPSSRMSHGSSMRARARSQGVSLRRSTTGCITAAAPDGRANGGRPLVSRGR